MTIFEVKQKKTKMKSESADVIRNFKVKNEAFVQKFKGELILTIISIYMNLEHKKLRIEQMKDQTERLNDDSYIPYTRPSDAADKHLEVNSFQTEAANATLDLAKRSNSGREKPKKVK